MSLIDKLTKLALSSLPSRLPESPGVYIFWSKKAPIYIGKSVNLKNRVSSYFSIKLETKTRRMVSAADELSFIKVTSELESLLLEAKLIRENQPKFNVISKDGKSPLYIRITKEKYPRVITGRKSAQEEANLAFFGPFPSAKSVRTVLRMIRRVFPYADHKLGKRPCFYSHIGLCNPCPSELERITNEKLRIMERKRYLANIRKITKLLRGEITKVQKDLRREMEGLAKDERYEEAAIIREQLKRLEYINQPITPVEGFLENPNLTQDLRMKELADLKALLRDFRFQNLPSLHRIECFDVAHLAGTRPTASMVTFINGEPEKNSYRHFRIRQARGYDDISSMKEVGKRRIKHLKDWGRPDLIIVDGGATQTAVFNRIFEKEKVPVIGLAKRLERIVVPVKEGKTYLFKMEKVRGHSLNLVARIRDEAHRFARRYHHKLVKITLVGKD